MTLTTRAISSQSIDFLPLLLLYVDYCMFKGFSHSFGKYCVMKIFTNDISFQTWDEDNILCYEDIYK